MGIIYDKAQAVSKTIDSQIVEAMVYEFIPNCSCKATLSLIARDSDSGDTWSVEFKFVCKMGSDPTEPSVIIGNIIQSMPVQKDASMLDASVAIVAAENSIVVNAGGVAGKNINWLTWIDITVYSPDPFSLSSLWSSTKKKIFKLFSL